MNDEDPSPPGRAWRVPVFVGLIGALGAVAAALIGHQQGVSAAAPSPAKTVIKYRTWASCPNTDMPMALLASGDQIVNPSPPPQLRGQVGSAHIDNVIAPDGSARVGKQERVCVTINQYPSHGRTLWLILRLLQPLKNPTYQLFYAVGELGDPVPGKYSVDVDRSCTAMPSGSRHTLMVVSADTKATGQLWDNYNARRNAKCNPKYDPDRRSLPVGTFVVSNSGDVIQH